MNRIKRIANVTASVLATITWGLWWGVPQFFVAMENRTRPIVPDCACAWPWNNQEFS